MMRGMTILWGILAIGVGIGLFLVKHQVQETESELRRVQAQVRADRSAIRVLEAEWTYLNDPARLGALAERVLSLQPLRAQQVVTMATLPVRPDSPPTRYYSGVDPLIGQGGTVPWPNYPRRKPGPELASVRGVQ